MIAPLVGITGRGIPAERIPAIPAKLSDVPVDLHFRNYSAQVHDAGGIPVQLTVASNPILVADRIDALILSGGADIDPARYGRAPEPGLQAIDPERDEFEWELLHRALERGIPVLGICRGMQVLNVFLGGTMVQDIEIGSSETSHLVIEGPPEHLAHPVVTEADSLARTLYGASCQTTSSHHQAVDTVGAHLRATGRADDGVVEILEHERLPAFGVQWHAEWHQPRDRAFDWLIDTARTTVR